MQGTTHTYNNIAIHIIKILTLCTDRDGDLYLLLGGRKFFFRNYPPNIGGAKCHFRPPT